MDKVVEFQKVIPITKAYEGDDGELYIEGESSGPEFDLDKQFMTPECVKDMSEQVNASPIQVYDEHQKRGILNDLGTAVKSELTPEIHMKPTVRLDKENPAAVTLWKKIKKGKQYGFSIAGRVLEPVKKTINGVIFQGFNRIVLDHIATTTKPSWAPSLGTLVAKSLEQEGFDWANVPEYEGNLDLPFSAHVVEKGSKPDPQAGKWYTLAEDILNKLNSRFGWASYQDMIDETNRDAIPFQDLPLAAKLPVGAIELSADDYDEDPEGYIQKMNDVMATPEERAPLDVQQMADLYQRLYWLAESLGRRDEQNGTKDGKKIVTRLKTAMAALAEAMKETLSKSEKPEPLTYGEPIQKVAQEPTGGTPMPNALKSFDDVVSVPPVTVQPHAPQPSVVGGGALTDFSQVAQTAQLAVAQPVAKAEPTDDLGQLVGEFGVAVQKTFAAEAPVDAKRQALAQIIRAFAEEAGGRLESQRPEEERIEKAVRETEARLMARIEQLEAQLAVVKSQPQAAPASGGEQPLVRKSLPGKRVVLQPARVVQKSSERPTFLDLVTGQGGTEW